MASVKYAAHIADLRGSVENATFSRNRLGAFMRPRFKPSDPKSQAQLTLRAYHADGVYAWRNTCTESQRSDWNDLALLTPLINRAGLQYYPTGFNLFMRMYLFVASGAGTPDLDAPDTAICTTPPLEFEGTDGGSLYITDDGAWFSGATGVLKIWIASDIGPARYYHRGPWDASAKIIYPEWSPIPPSISIPTLTVAPAGHHSAIAWRASDTSGQGIAVSAMGYAIIVAAAS